MTQPIEKPVALRPWIATLIASFLVWSAFSWGRAAFAGRLAFDPERWSTEGLVSKVVSGLLMIPAAIAYLRIAKRAKAGSVDELLRAAVLVHVAASLALPLVSDDLYLYLAYGRLSHVGHNPYLVGPRALGEGDPFLANVSRWWVDTPSAYGPVATWLGIAATVFPSVAVSMVLYKGAILAISIATVVVGARIARTRGELGARAFALFALNPLFAFELSGQSHNDGIMLLALVAFFAFALSERPWPALVVLAVGLYSKFGVAPVLALYLLHRWRTSPRQSIAMAAVVAAMGVACFAPFWAGPATFSGANSSAFGGVSRITRSPIDFVVVVSDLTGHAEHRAVLYTVLASIAYTIVALAALRAAWKTRTFGDVVRESVFFTFVWQVAMPWYQGWYATWLLPPLLVLEEERIHRIVVVFTLLQAIQYALPVESATNVAIDVWLVVALVRSWRMRRAAPAA